MGEKMKALVKKHQKPVCGWRMCRFPSFGINDVLIRIHKTAICGTDIHIWNWMPGHRKQSCTDGGGP